MITKEQLEATRKAICDVAQAARTLTNGSDAADRYLHDALYGYDDLVGLIEKAQSRSDGFYDGISLDSSVGRATLS